MENRHYLDKDIYRFFVAVNNQLDDILSESPNQSTDVEDDIDERTLFATNTIAQTAGHEMALMSNTKTSRTIQRLLPHVTDSGLLAYFSAIDAHICQLCEGRLASHAMQTLVVVCCGRPVDRMESVVASIVGRLIGRDYIHTALCHVSVSHVFRTCVTALVAVGAGPLSDSTSLAIGKVVDLRQFALDTSRLAPNRLGERAKRFRKLFWLVCRTVLRLSGVWCEHLADANVSACLQCLLTSLYYLRHSVQYRLVNRCTRYLSRYFQLLHTQLQFGISPPDVAADLRLSRLLSSPNALRLLECVLVIGESSCARALYSHYIKPSDQSTFLSACGHPLTQKLVTRCSEKLLRSVLDRFLDNITSSPTHITCATLTWLCETLESRSPAITELYCARVIEYLASFKQTSGAPYRHLVVCLLTTADTTRSLHSAITQSTTPSPSSSSSQFVDLAVADITQCGARAIQLVLTLAPPATQFAAQFLQSLLYALAPPTLLDMCTHVYASHVIDAVLRLLAASAQSDTHTTTIHTVYGDVFRGRLLQLACTCYGSRVLDTLISVCEDTELVQAAAVELSVSVAKLRADFYGRHVVQKLGLVSFVKNKHDWLVDRSRDRKRRRMIGSIA